MIKLKPTTSFCFSKEDYEFILELAKVGYVKLLSSQVELKSDRENYGITFIDHVGINKCDGLKLPDNWIIEYVCVNGGFFSITFGVKPISQTGI